MFSKIALALVVLAGSASAFSAYAQSPRGGLSSAIHQDARTDNSNSVFFAGRKVGQDPDANVRLELFRNAHTGE